jgi:WD40 repeat protein
MHKGGAWAVAVVALVGWLAVCGFGATSAWAAAPVLSYVGSFGTSAEAASAVSFSPSGRLLFSGSGSGGGSVSVFSVGPGGRLTQVPGSPFATGQSAPSSVAVSPSGGLLVTANELDSTLSMFAVGSGGQLTQVPGSPFSVSSPYLVSSVAFSPNGAFLAAAVGGQVEVFSVGSGGQLAQVAGSPFLNGSGSGASSVAFSPRGGLLATANPGGLETGAPWTVSIFSVGSGGQLTPLPGSPFGGNVNFSPLSVAFSPSGALLASMDFPASVSVFSIGSNGEPTAVPGSPFATGPFTGALGSVAFSADGRLLATDNGSLSVFSVGPNGQLIQVPGSPLSTGASAEGPELVAFSPSGGLLATADGGANAVSVFSVAPPPVPAVSQLSIRPRAFRAATHGPTIIHDTHTGALISYRDTFAAVASFTVYRVHWQRKCATPQRQRCRRLVLVGRFGRVDRVGSNAVRFSGRIRNRALSPGSYLLKLVANFSGSNSRTVTARFTILPPKPSRTQS